MGKAYGFFRCNTGREAIEIELKSIRQVAKIPSELELHLVEGLRNFQFEYPDLLEIVEKFKDTNINYVLEASLPIAFSNKKAAFELSDILNQAYQSPLYKEGEKFFGEVLYKDEGQYLVFE